MGKRFDDHRHRFLFDFNGDSLALLLYTQTKIHRQRIRKTKKETYTQHFHSLNEQKNGAGNIWLMMWACQNDNRASATSLSNFFLYCINNNQVMNDHHHHFNWKNYSTRDHSSQQPPPRLNYFLSFVFQTFLPKQLLCGRFLVWNKHIWHHQHSNCVQTEID